MSTAREKLKEIEFVTFNEFLEYGKNQPNANIVDGMPWSFVYKNINITHENDECYIISTENGYYYFTPNQYLITDEDGDTYPLDKELFNSQYDIINYGTQLNKING